MVIHVYISRILVYNEKRCSKRGVITIKKNNTKETLFNPLNINKEKHTLSERLPQYFANVALLLTGLAFYSTNKYYKGFLNPKALQILEAYVLGYTVFGFLIYTFILRKLKRETTGYKALRGIFSFISQSMTYLKGFGKNTENPVPAISFDDKRAILFILVKLFYLPLMANFCVNNFMTVAGQYDIIKSLSTANIFTMDFFNNHTYSILYNFIFTIDTLCFTFGYMFEADFLGNRIRSVEPTAFGWIVALLCYPPFNGLWGNYVDWGASDYPEASSTEATFIIRLVVLLLFLIFLWATLSLGTRGSNLTNRGIVSRGPYAFVRHPAYISKNLAWWISMLPHLNLQGILGMSAWSFLYFLRAVTEERHLMMDPDYQEYCKKVRYRFIPGIW